MKYNFDEIIPRKGVDSSKYDSSQKRGKSDCIIPLWVADMEFKAPEVVTQKLREAVEHSIFGYAETSKNYCEAVRGWFSESFDFDIDPSWLVGSPGVVFALATAIKSFTTVGDSIIIQEPVYSPFFKIVAINGRKVVNNNLIYQDGWYSIDFDDFEKKIIAHKVKLFILCSPHNPVGRVWTKEELMEMGRICLKHNCLIVADETYSDFIHEGHRHHVFSSLSENFLDNSIICTSPSKTFNLAGLQVSNIFIANPSLRCAFNHQMQTSGYEGLNSLGLVAGRAAYREGRPWLDQLNYYLAENFNFVRTFLEEKLPDIRLTEPQATFLAWLDFRHLNLSNKELDNLISNKAGLWLCDGLDFGHGGDGFQRMNLGCPKIILETALERLEKAVKST
ncbi:MAG: MalY/PatB family protein [Candidatus Adiutrix sp.]